MMKKRMEEISVGNAPKPVNEASHPSDTNNLPSVSGASKHHHLPEKFAPAAMNGEYVDFSDVLSTLSILRSTPSDEGMLRSLSSDLIAISRPQRKRLVDSFDLWLQVWTKYEMEIVSAQPERYLELAAYREQIQLANCKFRWPCVYMFDVQTRTRAATRKDIRLDVLDTTLYTTILDASALRAHPKQCTCCKSFDHLVRDCPFLAQEKLQEAATPAGTGFQFSGASAPDTWKFDKWFTATGQEGCNLYQRTSENGATLATPVNEPTFAKLVGGTTPRPIAQALPEIKSPFNPQMWRSCLWEHPDTDFVNDLLHDIEFGVRIGYQPVSRDYQIHTNHLSAILYPEPMAREIEREIDLNRKVGPFLTPPFENFTGSPLGAIPKKHSAPVKWRITHNLSWPAGLSVNDGIPKDLFTCTYDSLDCAIILLKKFGTGAVISKLDLSDAFRHILVNSRGLLGSTWPVEIDGTVVPGYFIDTFLPFGLRSSPALFSKICRGPQVCHV